MQYERTSMLEEAMPVHRGGPEEGSDSHHRWKMLAGGLCGLIIGAVMLYLKAAPTPGSVQVQGAKAFIGDTKLYAVHGKQSDVVNDAEKTVQYGDSNFVQLGFGSCSLDICGCYPTFVDMEGCLDVAKTACFSSPTCIGFDHSDKGQTARLYYVGDPPAAGLLAPATCGATDFNVAAPGCARGCDEAPLCFKKVCSLLYNDKSCAAALSEGFVLRPDAARRTGNASACCQCHSGLTDCNGRCVDVETSSRFCGSCKKRCRADQVCVGGLCQCPASTELCGGVCKSVEDYAADKMHCGGCGNVCTVKGQSCKDGICTCPRGKVVCNGQCVELTTDHNCGACGNVCNEGLTCDNGKCKCLDPESFECSGKCVNLADDEKNCGSCGNVCLKGQTCKYGRCKCDDDVGNGANSVPVTDGVAPTGGRMLPHWVRKVACDGQCVDLYESQRHCGACGNVCNQGQSCYYGQCKCTDPKDVECNGQCVCPDSFTTNYNCGACGNVCNGDLVCRGPKGKKKCQCDAGKELCHGNCKSASDYKTDDSNCGGCGNVCNAVGQRCIDGKCQCASGGRPAPNGKVACDGQCVDLYASQSHCGACGNVCSKGQSCNKGQCCEGSKEVPSSQTPGKEGTPVRGGTA